MKAKLLRYSVIFLCGCAVYPCIELIWRGRSHISMALLGGLSAFSVAWLDGQMKKGYFLLKAALSAVMITQLEWIFGTVLNLHLRLDIWDYSAQPYNLKGQICPLFSFYWFLLALFFIFILDLERTKKRKRQKAVH